MGHLTDAVYLVDILFRQSLIKYLTRSCEKYLSTFLTPSRQRVQLELIHDQLPLAVPCYDLVLVIEFTVGRREDELRALPTPLT